jgi:L-malate glycosyltransferase
MKILHTVQSYPPAEGGMAEVVRQISERLSAKGHSVTVATERHPARTLSCMNGVDVIPFAVSGNTVNGLVGDVAEYAHFLLESRFDIVVNFAAQQWATDIALPLLPRIAGCKVFVPTGFSGLNSRRYRNYFKQMPAFMRQYDMNIFLSNSYRDICFARKHGISNTRLIPNGSASDEFLAPVKDVRSQLDIPEKHFLILLVGSHTGLKGHEEAMEIFSQADIRDATLLIVGNEPPGGCGANCCKQSVQKNLSTLFEIMGKRIIVTSLSRADTVSAYHAADLFLFPSNIECSPIVLFECMASRTPFLVTDVGNSAEIIDWSEGSGALLPSLPPLFLPRNGTLMSRAVEKLRILLGRSDDFTAVRANISGSVDMLDSIYRNPNRREQMSEAGFLAWQKRFTWEIISTEYETLYRKLLRGEHAI